MDGQRCEQVQEALSAALDGEAAGLDDDAVQAHLGTCGDCRAYADAVATATRRARLRQVEAPVDVSDRVLAAQPRSNPLGLPGQGPWPLERVLLLVLGVAQLVLALPVLFGSDLAASLHVRREVGVTDLALAIGLLAATWQPWRAAGMLPVIVTLAGGLATVAVVDIARGDVSALGELPHLLAPVSALLLYALRRRTPTPTGGSGAHGPPALRPVTDEDRRSA